MTVVRMRAFKVDIFFCCGLALSDSTLLRSPMHKGQVIYTLIQKRCKICSVPQRRIAERPIENRLAAKSARILIWTNISTFIKVGWWAMFPLQSKKDVYVAYFHPDLKFWTYTIAH